MSSPPLLLAAKPARVGPILSLGGDPGSSKFPVHSQAPELPPVLSLPARPRQSVRQFDPIGMLLVPLVFLAQDFFEPIGLTISDRLIHGRGRMINDEVIAACVAPQNPHCLKISNRLISRLVFLYCNCFHAVNFSESPDFIGALAAGRLIAQTLLQFNLATTISKVQITPTRTNAITRAASIALVSSVSSSFGSRWA